MRSWAPSAALSLVVCIADLTLGDILFNLFVHTRPLERFPCWHACINPKMTEVKLAFELSSYLKRYDNAVSFENNSIL